VTRSVVEGRPTSGPGGHGHTRRAIRAWAHGFFLDNAFTSNTGRTTPLTLDERVDDGCTCQRAHDSALTAAPATTAGARR